MRPVTKGPAPPAYPYATSAFLQTQPAQFNANSAVARCYNNGATYNTNLDQVQDHYLANVTPPPSAFPFPQTQAIETKCRNRLEKRLEKIYTTAKEPLFATIGTYCSFCETPIPGHILAVEHRAPKSLYPTVYLIWDNFTLACRDCNSIKLTQPPRATAQVWSGVPYVDEDTLIDAIKARFYWPDLSSRTYRNIRRRYYRRAGDANPELLTAAQVSARQNVLGPVAGNIVRGQIWNTAGTALRPQRRVESRIEPTSARGTRTAQLTGLDRTGTPRSCLRTLAWFSALTEYKSIRRTVRQTAAPDKDRIFRALWRASLRVAVREGFYSTWLDVFQNANWPAGVNQGGHASLGAKFVFDTNPANGGPRGQVFYGTNVTNLP
jgi:hypothetical protein